MSSWDTARTEELISLRAQKLSGSEIGAILKVSRNAAVGKLWRLARLAKQRPKSKFANIKSDGTEEIRRTRQTHTKQAERAKTYADWKRDGYIPTEYIAPPKSKHRLFDHMWWASLSRTQQLHILSMPTHKVYEYASYSKQRFEDGG